MQTILTALTTTAASRMTDQQRFAVSAKQKNGDAREEERRRRSLYVRPREEERAFRNLAWGLTAPVLQDPGGREEESRQSPEQMPRGGGEGHLISVIRAAAQRERP